jgi:hypothetical protein
MKPSDRRNDGSGTFCPAPSVTTKAAPMSSTVQGGGYRRSLTKFPLRDLLLSKGNYRVSVFTVRTAKLLRRTVP